MAANYPRRPLSILLVEDQPINRLTVQFLLDPMGVELAMACDGAEGVRMFRMGSFDLVLMDIDMPVMDGLAATSAIRDYERATGATRTPVAMLTGRTSPKDHAAATAAGADAHLSKPVDPNLLQSLIRQLTARRTT
ncbi:response regulator [Phenylobacterium montanum]|uniref:Response regulator n=1 Tax=Phenylobacterium montanum TaxID=2823693 RepID=A0A975G2Z2_9CAUL|nr:response regulator [Caulobacter sp. S6]QUD89603.1 response regulator [Caulobacter sp. S6]